MKKLFDSSGLFQSFRERQGGFVMSSALIARLVNFISSIVIIWLISKAEYGYLTYALTIIAFVMPLVGGGVTQGLLRYGALCQGQIEKKHFLRFALRRGLIYSTILLIVVWLTIPLTTSNLPASGPFLALLGLQLIGYLFYAVVQVYCLLIHRNKLYSKVELTNSVLLLFCNLLGAVLFGAIGYVISLVLIPFLVGIYYYKKLNLGDARPGFNFDFDEKTLLRYGLYTSVGVVLSSLLYSVDILLIGNIFKEGSSVAQYKASSLIPLNLVILAASFMTIYNVKLARNAIHDPSYLLAFYQNYLKIFLPLSVVVLLVFYFGSTYLMLIFGPDYQGDEQLMFIFAIGVVGNFLFRTPLGNMMANVGWVKANGIFSLIVLLVNIAGSYWAIPRYGLVGAAAVTSGMFWLAGLFSLGAMSWWYFLKMGDGRRETEVGKKENEDGD